MSVFLSSATTQSLQWNLIFIRVGHKQWVCRFHLVSTPDLHLSLMATYDRISPNPCVNKWVHLFHCQRSTVFYVERGMFSSAVVAFVKGWLHCKCYLFNTEADTHKHWLYIRSHTNNNREYGVVFNSWYLVACHNEEYFIWKEAEGRETTDNSRV